MTRRSRYSPEVKERAVHGFRPAGSARISGSLTAQTVPLNLQPRYNGAPEQEFAACRLDDDGNRTMVDSRRRSRIRAALPDGQRDFNATRPNELWVSDLTWCHVPSWARDVRGTRLINATVGDHPHEAVIRRRLRFASMPGASRWVVRVATDR